jgi:adenylylsulfate kinase-like enzyme
LCLPDTRVQILHQIREWADGNDTRHIFWLNGWAGTGKSTIARTIAREHFDRGKLGASFFFSKGDKDTSHAGKFVTTIARQLAQNVPSLLLYICEVIKERGDIINQSLRDQ